MEEYKQRFIEFMIDCNVLKFGDFVTKSGRKTPLNLFVGESIGRMTRYFLIVIVAGILWPLTFKFFQKSSTKET